jgi:OOP family OmpA-OmpF porin
LAEFLNSETRIQKIVLMIYTHSRGDLKADKRLGDQRGQAIKKLLVSEGVNASRVSVFSYGSEKSIDSNLTRRGRQRNQRVMMRIKSVDL